MNLVDQADYITAEEVTFAAQLGVLRLMYARLGTVNISKSIRYGGKTVGHWVHSIRVSVRTGLQGDDVNEFIKETDLCLMSDYDLTPKQFLALLEEKSKGQYVDTTKVDNKDLERLLDTKETPDLGAGLKAKLLSEDRTRFGEIILRLLSIKAVRGNIHLPRKCTHNGWDAAKCIEELRARKEDRKLEMWKVNALNQIGMVWSRNYPMR